MKNDYYAFDGIQQLHSSFTEPLKTDVFPLVIPNGKLLFNPSCELKSRTSASSSTNKTHVEPRNITRKKLPNKFSIQHNFCINSCRRLIGHRSMDHYTAKSASVIRMRICWTKRMRLIIASHCYHLENTMMSSNFRAMSCQNH